MKFADPKNDLAFKKIFGNEKHKDILISFLNSVLDFKDENIDMALFIKERIDYSIELFKSNAQDSKLHYKHIICKKDKFH